MKIFVIKTLSGLLPATSTDQDKLNDAKLKLNEMYEVEIRKPRNIQFHKKLFSLLNLCFDNQEYFDNLDELRAYLTMKAGFNKKITTPNGEFYLPKSISFASMDEIEFESYYNAIVQQVIYLLDCTNEDLVSALMNY